MRPSSAKAKGRKLQQEVRDIILEHFKELEPDDVKTAIMGESGQDIKLSPAARRVFPYAVECKNVEKINVWSALEQAEDNSNDNQTPLLVFRKNRTKTYVSLSLDDFMKLIKKNQ